MTTSRLTGLSDSLYVAHQDVDFSCEDWAMPVQGLVSNLRADAATKLNILVTEAVERKQLGIFITLAMQHLSKS